MCKHNHLNEFGTALTSNNLINFLTAELPTMAAVATNTSFNAKSKYGSSKQQSFVSKQSQRQEKEQSYKPTSLHALAVQSVNKTSPQNVCLLSFQQHYISVCLQFLNLLPAQRLNELEMLQMFAKSTCQKRFINIWQIYC